MYGRPIRSPMSASGSIRCSQMLLGAFTGVQQAAVGHHRAVHCRIGKIGRSGVCCGCSAGRRCGSSGKCGGFGGWCCGGRSLTVIYAATAGTKGKNKRCTQQKACKFLHIHPPVFVGSMLVFTQSAKLDWEFQSQVFEKMEIDHCYFMTIPV